MHLKNMLFKPSQPDPLDILAGSRAGVMASLIGIAARKLIETGARMKIDPKSKSIEVVQREVRVEDLIDVSPDWDYWRHD